MVRLEPTHENNARKESTYHKNLQSPELCTHDVSKSVIALRLLSSEKKTKIGTLNNGLLKANFELLPIFCWTKTQYNP